MFSMIARAITALTAWMLFAPLSPFPFVALAPGFLSAQQSADEGRSFDSNGVPMHYVDRGRGAPVVLVHGFTGSYARHWETPGVMQALESAGYRVIAMDCRGHGRSGKPRTADEYGLEMVRDVVRLLDHLKIDRAHIVGYSMGGAIAMQLLVGHPSRLLTATLVGAGWEGDHVAELTSQMNLLADGFAKRDASALIRGVGAGQKPPTEEEVAALNTSMFERNDPEVLAAAARGMPPLYEVSADSLRATTLPVLAIIGEHDRNLQRPSGWAVSSAASSSSRSPGPRTPPASVSPPSRWSRS